MEKVSEDNDFSIEEMEHVEKLQKWYWDLVEFLEIHTGKLDGLVSALNNCPVTPTYIDFIRDDGKIIGLNFNCVGPTGSFLTLTTSPEPIPDLEFKPEGDWN